MRRAILILSLLCLGMEECPDADPPPGWYKLQACNPSNRWLCSEGHICRGLKLAGQPMDYRCVAADQLPPFRAISPLP